MCGDCWNAAMAAPTAVVAARFAWVGYRDRIPFLNRRAVPVTRCQAPSDRDATEVPELVDAGAPPP